ncbi:MAG: hypothetical protein LBB29_04255 [Holosporaceae bacterium]|nr:hypothetical protein [Holosporaceae bacterium]
MTHFFDGISHRIVDRTAFFLSRIASLFVRNTKNFNKKLHYLAVPIASGQKVYGVGYVKKNADRLSTHGRDTSCRY